MEEKTDKVVGYIEYLGAGGMIGEIVPYTSVEKFKDEILDSLDCGRPVTPVVFSDELDEPLQFDSDTYFPWGFRSEKRVQIPYEIYQTNRRDLVFMEYSPARLAAGAKDYELVYKGQMERWETLDSIYSRHNRDDRPNAKSMRSVSVSDIIVTHKDNETHAFYVQPIGYKQVDNLLPEALRHEFYICADIEADAAMVQEKLRQAELAAQQERNEVKEDEYKRRSSRPDGARGASVFRGGY